MTISRHIYFAAPLFSQADFLYNAHLVAKIRQLAGDFTLYLPQENAAINEKSAYADSKMIAKADLAEVLKSDLVVALLDGPTIDPGVASEIGIAYGKNIPVIALYTDSRQQGSDNQQKISALGTIAENQFHYVNLFTAGLVKLNGVIVNQEASLIDTIEKWLESGNVSELS